MIDAHCHLEQKEYDQDLDKVIKKCKDFGIKAIISNCAHPKDFEKAKKISQDYKDFVFLVGGVHPAEVENLTDGKIEKAFNWLRENKDVLYGIGEQGLDYFWIKDQKLREKQKELFVKSIKLAKDLDKVLVVHTRDAHEEVIRILEENGAKKVQLHMWGDNKFVKEIIDNNWYVSVGPVIAHSKKHKKVVRDMPIERLMLETDSPWFGGNDSEGKVLRGDPTNILIPAEEIAKIKKVSLKEVFEICGKNAVNLFSLPIRV
ncbi:MAG: TatD family hydrolase [Candidatus Pacearchaeota archaeon]|nr:TatD family hydrolase [Candidatus Pacearchaeota archaeon]